MRPDHRAAGSVQCPKISSPIREVRYAVDDGGTRRDVPARCEGPFRHQLLDVLVGDIRSGCVSGVADVLSEHWPVLRQERCGRQTRKDEEGHENEYGANLCHRFVSPTKTVFDSVATAHPDGWCGGHLAEFIGVGSRLPCLVRLVNS